MRYIIITSAVFFLAFLPNAARADTADCEHMRSRDGHFSRYLCRLPADDECTVFDAKEGLLLCNKEIEIPEKKPDRLKCEWRRTNNGKRAVCW